MPKEAIYDDAGTFDLMVGWSPGKYVQVGIETHSGATLVDQLGCGADPVHPTFTGVWGTFDRAGLNRAIRMLRKARDEAFGRDE